MYELLIWLAPPFVLGLLLIKWLTGWAARVAGNRIEAKFRAAESLANWHTTPAAWLAPHRARLAELQAQGAAEPQVTQLLESARSDCLRRLDELVRYFADGTFVDSVQTRDALVQALQSERKRMEKEDWRALLLPQSAAEMSQQAQGGTGATQPNT
jgi:hypothetical protein